VKSDEPKDTGIEVDRFEATGRGVAHQGSFTTAVEELIGLVREAPEDTLVLKVDKKEPEDGRSGSTMGGANGRRRRRRPV
jgi:hypothetical protein